MKFQVDLGYTIQKHFTILDGITGLTIVFTSLPNGKILDWSRLKAFAHDKNSLTEKLKFVLDRVENIVGKEENAGYQDFLYFPQCFQKLSFSGSIKVGNCVVKRLRTVCPSSSS